jgi:hypothetical protein
VAKWRIISSSLGGMGGSPQLAANRLAKSRIMANVLIFLCR